ncbi:MAG: hypothetical protein H8E37_14095 [Planctomycetes bacterium]|nr:hypothetical protein [Planctomycetota bacterium]
MRQQHLSALTAWTVVLIFSASLLRRYGTTTTAILGAVTMGLLGTDFRAIAEEKREPGIAGISKGRPAVAVPADVLAGETRWYGVGFAFQVGPGLASLTPA